MSMEITEQETYEQTITKMTKNLTSMAKIIAMFCESKTEDASAKNNIATIIETMTD